MAKGKRWIVTTSGDRPLSDVSKDLKKKGFHVAQVLDEVGLITGEGSDEMPERLRDIPGVTDVSPEAAVDIGPPDSDETW